MIRTRRVCPTLSKWLTSSGTLAICAPESVCRETGSTNSVSSSALSRGAPPSSRVRATLPARSLDDIRSRLSNERLRERSIGATGALVAEAVGVAAMLPFAGCVITSLALANGAADLMAEPREMIDNDAADEAMTGILVLLLLDDDEPEARGRRRCEALDAPELLDALDDDDDDGDEEAATSLDLAEVLRELRFVLDDFEAVGVVESVRAAVADDVVVDADADAEGGDDIVVALESARAAGQCRSGSGARRAHEGRDAVEPVAVI